MKRCQRCVIEENTPGVRIDASGVCNHCHDYDRTLTREVGQKSDSTGKFHELIEAHAGQGGYDGIIAYSGGKDSTYALHLVKEKYKLNVLAMSFDNWFQSEDAKKNIQTVTAHLNVDHITIRPGFDNMRELILAGNGKSMYPPKAMARASAICTTCLFVIRSLCNQIAFEKQIPFVFFGLSPGQAPVATGIYKMNPVMMRQMQKAIAMPLQREVGKTLDPYLFQDRHFANPDAVHYSVNPFAFDKYHEEQILEKIAAFGWRRPTDTDTNSSNCLLNSYAIEVHQEQFGFHPYQHEIATLVREGTLDRQEGLERLATPPDPTLVASIKSDLGVADKR